MGIGVEERKQEAAVAIAASIKGKRGATTGETMEALGAGKKALDVAGKSAIGAQTSNSIANSNKSINKTTTVQTGPITIQTQATDAQGVAGALGSNLNDQMRQASSSFDDGVEA